MALSATINDEGRALTRSQTRATTLGGEIPAVGSIPEMLATVSTGGGGSKPKPYTGAPTSIETPKKPLGLPVLPPGPKADPYIPPPPPPVPPTPPENVFGRGPKTPQPVIPDVSRIKGRVPIETELKRYTVGNDRFTVSALSEGVGQSKDRIKPISFTMGRRPELKPLLEADGIVVKVGEHHLVSPQTLADIQNSGNPHYDIVGNGTILKTSIGRSVPIIELDMRKVMDSGQKMDAVNRFAGVKSVDYVYESETIMGVPEALLNQINYTLNPKRERPADRFEVFNIRLSGNYANTPTQVVKPGPDGKFSKTELQKVVAASAGRMDAIRKDLNVIKDIYFGGGVKPENTAGVTVISKQAKPIDPVEEAQRASTTAYTKKTITLIGHSAVPLSNGWGGAASSTTSTGPGATVNTTGNTPAAVGSEKDNLINRWNSYDLNAAQKSELKGIRANQYGTKIRLDNGFEIPIDGVYFSPPLWDKLMIIPDAEFNTFRNGLDPAQGRIWDKMVAYYGLLGNFTSVPNPMYNNIGGTADFNRNMAIEWNRTLIERYRVFNNKRLAEVLYLTTRIKEFEITDGKIF